MHQYGILVNKQYNKFTYTDCIPIEIERKKQDITKTFQALIYIYIDILQ